MNITVQNPINSEQTIEIELSEVEMEKYYHQAIQKISTQINIHGFRPGKIPTEVVEREVKKEQIFATAIDMALPPTYAEAVKKENIEPIGHPQIKIISENPLKYEAIIPLYPEVKVEDQSKIKVSKDSTEASDQDIEDEIKRMSKHHSIYKAVDRTAKHNDKMEIDFDGFDESGVPLEGTNSKNHPLILGEDTLVPGFEAELIGLKKGEQKDITITFPGDYFHTPFQNKKVRFHIKVNTLEEVIPPKLHDLIKKVSGKDLTEEAFKALLKENISKEKIQHEQDRLENNLLEQILKHTKLTIPHGLIDEEINYMIDEQKQNIEKRGMKWEDYLTSKNLTQEQLYKELHPDAEKRLTLRFGVQQLFKELNIDITEQELQKAWDNEMKILSSLDYSPTELDLNNLKTKLKNKLKMEKLVSHFIE